MNVLYRKLFLSDLKKIKNHESCSQIFEIAFTALPQAERLQDLANVKAMRNFPKRYRIRVGNFRIGIEVQGDTVEVMRVLHRKEFYRYFP